MNPTKMVAKMVLEFRPPKKWSQKWSLRTRPQNKWSRHMVSQETPQKHMVHRMVYPTSPHQGHGQTDPHRGPKPICTCVGPRLGPGRAMGPPPPFPGPWAPIPGKCPYVCVFRSLGGGWGEGGLANSKYGLVEPSGGYPMGLPMGFPTGFPKGYPMGYPM